MRRASALYLLLLFTSAIAHAQNWPSFRGPREVFNRNAVATSSPGLPARLPWDPANILGQPHRGCVCFV